MRIKTIGVHYKRKVNTGEQYENAEIAIDLYADLDEEDQAHIPEIEAGLWQVAKNQVMAQVIPLKKQNSAQLKELFLGLPVELQEALNSHHEEISDGG